MKLVFVKVGESMDVWVLLDTFLEVGNLVVKVVYAHGIVIACYSNQIWKTQKSYSTRPTQCIDGLIKIHRTTIAKNDIVGANVIVGSN